MIKREKERVLERGREGHKEEDREMRLEREKERVLERRREGEKEGEESEREGHSHHKEYA